MPLAPFLANMQQKTAQWVHCLRRYQGEFLQESMTLVLMLLVRLMASVRICHPAPWPCGKKSVIGSPGGKSFGYARIRLFI